MIKLENTTVNYTTAIIGLPDFTKFTIKLEYENKRIVQIIMVDLNNDSVLKLNNETEQLSAFLLLMREYTHNIEEGKL